MNVLKMQNQKNEQNDRLNDIREAYANGHVTDDQYSDLINDESETSDALRLKRIGLALILGIVGLLFVASL